MKRKTHRGAAKRFRVTGTGKVKRSHANASHIMSKKSQARKRRLRKSAILTKANAANIKEMLRA